MVVSASVSNMTARGIPRYLISASNAGKIS
jgi:hypothetical protein